MSVSKDKQISAIRKDLSKVMVCIGSDYNFLHLRLLYIYERLGYLYSFTDVIYI